MKTLPSLPALIQRTRTIMERAALAPSQATIKKETLVKWVISAGAILGYIMSKGLAG